MKYVVDTCIINKLVDGTLSLERLPCDGDYVASHIQVDELNKTTNDIRRTQLLEKFSAVIDLMAPTESFVIGTSRIGSARISDGKTFPTLKASLDALNNAKQNNIQDSLIAEIALKNDYTLITTDKNLSEAAAKHGCKVIYINYHDVLN